MALESNVSADRVWEEETRKTRKTRHYVEILGKDGRGMWLATSWRSNNPFTIETPEQAKEWVTKKIPLCNTQPGNSYVVRYLRDDKEYSLIPVAFL